MRFVCLILVILAFVCGDGFGEVTLVGIHATDTIHRFFDSSPFSADENYIAIAELPRSQMKESSSLPYANITLFYMGDREPRRIVIDKSLAWGAQLGAQVQVVGDKVFYNILDFNAEYCQGRSDFIFPDYLHYTKSTSLSECHRSLNLHGRIYDIKSKSILNLPCAVYHVSADGRYTSSVSLWDMQHAQRGYGIDWMGVPPRNFFDSLLYGRGDGVWINDVERNHCSMLYSLSEIAQQLQLNNTLRKVYGFHTKWSFDNMWLMVVLRTLEPADSSGRGRVRVQHLVVVKNYMKNHQSQMNSLKEIRYVFSWASKPFYDAHSSSKVYNLSTVRILCDGNHPNWKPNSHIITMNLQKPSTLYITPTVAVNNGFASLYRWISQWTSLPSTIRTSIFGGINSVKRKEWFTVAINIDLISSFPAFPLFHTDFQLQYLENSLLEEAPFPARSKPNSLVLQIVAPFGVGHPSFSPDGQYIITDTYPKEIDHIRHEFSFLFRQQENAIRREIVQNGAIYAPILLFPTLELFSAAVPNASILMRTNTTQKLLDVPVTQTLILKNLFNSSPWGLKRLLGKDVVNKRIEHAWRCDPHPAWSSSGRFVALNIFNVTTNTRKVLILKIPKA